MFTVSIHIVLTGQMYSAKNHLPLTKYILELPLQMKAASKLLGMPGKRLLMESGPCSLDLSMFQTRLPCKTYNKSLSHDDYYLHTKNVCLSVYIFF